MRSVYALVHAALLLTACAAAPQLEPRPAGNPMQVDLSGQWVLRGGQPLPAATEQTIRIPPTTARATQSGSRSDGGRSRSRDSSVHVFLESGDNLKVTQTDYGLFFSFDRAIVEEYNFGENRVVNVGPIKAQRVSGWEGREFVAETMDRNGNLLTERWQLGDDRASLIRNISITKQGKVHLELRQEFVRD